MRFLPWESLLLTLATPTLGPGLKTGLKAWAVGTEAIPAILMLSSGQGSGQGQPLQSQPPTEGQRQVCGLSHLLPIWSRGGDGELTLQRASPAHHTVSFLLSTSCNLRLSYSLIG